MVPNRFTRKVTVLLVPGMAVAEGEREVARGESNRQSIWGKTEKASASLFLENLVHVEARAGNQVTFPLFLWRIRSHCALFMLMCSKTKATTI